MQVLGIGGKLDVSKTAERQKELEEREDEEGMPYAETLTSIYYDIIGELTKVVNEEKFRIVVFIDDLDRCLPEKAVELLEAIKLFLDLPGYVFIMGVDRDVIERGIKYHYRFFEKEGRQTVKAEKKKGERGSKSKDEERIISPDDYLDKMIQVPLRIPPVEQTRKTDYIMSLLGKDSGYAKYASLIDIGISGNPRSLKRFINLLAFMGRLAERLKNDVMKDEKESPEHKEMIKKGFKCPFYVKWSVIVYRYKKIHRQIEANRSLLFEMQQTSQKKSDKAIKEGDSHSVGGLSMPEPLRKLLADKPYFPENDWLIKMYVHLAVSIEKPSADPDISGEAVIRSGEVKPGDMALVRKGSFKYGHGKNEAEIEYDYWIDIFPVTNQQYLDFLNDLDWPEHLVPFREDDWAEPYSWDKDKRACPAGKEKHPVVLVSYEDALAFCKWRSTKAGHEYRLPTEEEWEKAARGNEGREYPWSDEFDIKKCNVEEVKGGTTPVDEYPKGVSPYGCYDMAGNVWEWTSSNYDSETKVLRGGSWNNDRTDARCADRVRNTPDERFNVIGFRCAGAKSAADF